MGRDLSEDPQKKKTGTSIQQKYSQNQLKLKKQKTKRPISSYSIFGKRKTSSNSVNVSRYNKKNKKVKKFKKQRGMSSRSSLANVENEVDETLPTYDKIPEEMA